MFVTDAISLYIRLTGPGDQDQDLGWVDVRLPGDVDAQQLLDAVYALAGGGPGQASQQRAGRQASQQRAGRQAAIVEGQAARPRAEAPDISAALRGRTEQGQPGQQQGQQGASRRE
jgi:hypothetical protein